MNCRWRVLISVLTLSILALSATAAEQFPSPNGAKTFLFESKSQGGLTPKGLGLNLLRLRKDGMAELYSIANDARIGDAKNKVSSGAYDANGWFKEKVPMEDVQRLQKSVEDTNFEKLPMDANALAPSAYDGQDTTVVFYTSEGVKTIDLWKVKDADQVQPIMLFRKIQTEMLTKALR